MEKGEKIMRTQIVFFISFLISFMLFFYLIFIKYNNIHDFDDKLTPYFLIYFLILCWSSILFNFGKNSNYNSYLFLILDYNKTFYNIVFGLFSSFSFLSLTASILFMTLIDDPWIVELAKITFGSSMVLFALLSFKALDLRLKKTKKSNMSSNSKPHNKVDSKE